MTDCPARIYISDEYIDPYIEDLSCNHITVQQIPTPTPTATPTPTPGSGNGSGHTPTPTPTPTATPTPMPTSPTPTPIPTNIGSALIISVPPYAKIFIDTEDTGMVTNILIQNIPIGVHTYKLTYPGYTDVDGILFIDLNSMYKLSVIMEKTPGYLDPTKLAIFTIAASMLMVYIVQRKKKDTNDSVDIKNDIKRKR